MPAALARLLPLLALASLLPACGGPEEQPPPPPPDVVVAEPEVRDVTTYYRYSGRTASPEVVEVRARVAGVLEEQHFTASSDIEAGTRLFTIERRPFEVAVEAAEAAVTEAEANVTLAEVERDRVNEAFEAGAASEQESLEREATVKAEQARLAAARSRLHDAQIELGYTEVSSPITGRVGRREADLGNLVGRTEPTVLTRVVQLDPIHVYFDVSERILLEYLARGRSGRVGQDEAPPLEVSLANNGADDFPFAGRIDFVETQADADSGTIQVRGEIPNPGKALFPGLFVRIRVPNEVIEDAVLVKRDALGRSLAGDTLMLVGEGDEAEQRVVRLGEVQGDSVVVLEGLEPGERYILRGLQSVKPGDPVNPLTQEEMEKKLEESARIGERGGQGEEGEA